ncbi:MAG: YajQ family cyclic di-GMP-binding protein [Rhodocyclaceae bacterium]|nr:YajQ family cyclic di-GMP-binding protein [Rhodocyclaceae bacterium]
MPSFDITSEVDLVALRNAVDVANRKIGNRYDFKGSDCRVEQSDKLLTMFADSDFQLDQMQGILLPEMTAKKIDIRCLEHREVQKVSGNKVKQELLVRVGVEQDIAKKIQRLLKDAKLKVQASIQGESLRVSGAKRDVLQEAIALVRKSVPDFPLQFGNFRD